MGLNMDVDHVAFAGLSKFDGHRPRPLTAPEIAQIAGRAGRGMRDGTFGTTAHCPPLPEEAVRAVENHSFSALEQLCWRNADLDFSDIDALLASLSAPPPLPGLVRGNDASDVETLAALAREPEIRALADSRRRVGLLWESCQIPDFRKLADDTHTKLCARIFGHVVRDGALPTDWLAAQIAALARPEGDIDTLMQRLAGIRVWTYIAARADWVRESAHWQAQARDVEDLLSDALHERLISRFVDRRATHLLRRLDAAEADDLLAAVTRRGEVVVEGHPVGDVAGFSFHPDPQAAGEEKKLFLRAARRALRAEMPRRVMALQAAEDGAFALLADARIAWESVPVARLRRGRTPLRPHIEVLASEFLDGPQRERIRRRLQAFLDAAIRRDLAPLFAAAESRDPALRGPLHRLVEGLGLVPGAADDIPPALRGPLKALGVRAGRYALFMPAVLKPRAQAMRALLWAIQHGRRVPTLPAPGLVSIIAPADWPEEFADAMGWVAAGPVLLRLDIAERLAAELCWATRRRPVPLPAGLASRLSVRAEILPAVLRRLGMRVLPAAGLSPEIFGPPAPAMLAALRRRPVPPPGPAAAVPDSGPFAALAALRR